MTSTRPILRPGGYLPIEDHGLIGDGSTAALVGRDGTISWMCLPRFDSPPIFCALLDRSRGGELSVSPVGLVESSQRYVGDSAVLVTRLRTAEGVMELTDLMVLRDGADLRDDVSSGRRELLRRARVLSGRLRLRVGVRPFRGARVEPRGQGLRLRLADRPELEVDLLSTRPLGGPESELELGAGEQLELLLSWGESRRRRIEQADLLIEKTVESWSRWAGQTSYHGPRADLVRRSAITLKLLHYAENGAMVAAPTSSLPEAIGGPRNWDYRFSWIRDAAFAVYALRKIGFDDEAEGFLAWVLNTVEANDRPGVLHTLDGAPPAPEREDDALAGYRDSRPVRWGNHAYHQSQHDAIGEILDCAYQWRVHGGDLPPLLWARLDDLAEEARRRWREPDRGIWEIRAPGRPFTYSAALCHVALDRAARMAARFALPGDADGWRREAETIRRSILEQGWSEKQQAIAQHLGGDALDASVLALPLRRVLSPTHPRMIQTVDAVRRELGAKGGLLYRYLPTQASDGLSGGEGAFVICSFWLVDNLALQGRFDEANDLFETLCRRTSELGLLAEEIDPGSGAFLGNFPQAISHVGLISAAVNLSRAGR